LMYEAAAIHFKIPVALGIQSRDDYLTARVERYPAFQWVNENVPPRYTILTTDFRGYYIHGRTWSNQHALHPLLHRTIDEHIEWMKARGIRYWLYADAYASESPGIRHVGLYHLYQRWRKDRRFVLVKSLDLARPGGGTERVEIYQVTYD
jgi:hypothetical protein